MKGRIVIPLLIICSAIYLMKSTGIFPKNTFGVPFTLTLWVITSLTCLLAPALAVIGHLKNLNSPILKPAIVLLVTGLTGWLMFWAWFLDPSFGRATSIAVLLISALSLLLRPASMTHIGRPLAFVFIISTSFTAITFDHGGFHDGTAVAQGRYWVTTDNEIPQTFADRLIEGRETLLPALQGDWQSSDRPPLETGMMFSSYGFVKAKAKELSYFVLGVLTNSLWIFGFWSLLRAIKIDERDIGLIVLSTALVGAVFINTVYTWPKLLAAAMTLAAIACVVESQRNNKALCFALAGAIAALAMLSHGAAIFGLMGFSAYLAFTRSIPSLKNIAISSLVALVLYLPWTAYQKLYDGPGDRLLKWQLAGMTHKNDSIGTLEAIKTEYKNAGLEKVIENKIKNLRIYLIDPTFDNSMDAENPVVSTGWLRWFTMFRMGPAPLFLMIALPLLFVRRVYSDGATKFLLANIGLSSVAFLVLVFGDYPNSSAFLHTSPYSVLLMWCALFPLAVSLYRPSWLPGYTAITGLLFLLLWVIDVPNGTAIGYWSDSLSADGVIYSMRILPLALLFTAFCSAAVWSDRPTERDLREYAKTY